MLLTASLAALAAYAGIILLAYLAQERLIYFPSKALMGSPEQIGLAYESVWIRTEDQVRIHGWFVPTANARQTVLFLHGNAGNISHRLQSLRLFNALGLSVLIVDYRGYGNSEGKTDEQGTYRDADAAWRYLTQTRELAPESIVVFGRSLGGAVAVWLAGTRRVGGLIMEASFTSLPELARRHYPWLPVKALARIHYPSLARLPNVGCAVLIAHSRNDEVVPFWHGKTLYASALQPKRFVELEGGHNDGFIVTGERYAESLRSFFGSLLTASARDRNVTRRTG